MRSSPPTRPVRALDALAEALEALAAAVVLFIVLTSLDAWLTAGLTP